MSWRVVVVTQRCKLEYKLGYLVCRGEELKKVFLDEIDTLIIESTGVSLTAALLCELVSGKVNVIFCDEKHNPHSQLVALNGRHNASGCLRDQLEWDDGVKDEIWAHIVRLKINRQRRLLEEVGSEQAALLAGYEQDVLTGDITNREGHAAKVYFNVLFGLTFKRAESNYINGALNYGYAILLSAFNRALVAEGLNTQLGIAHKNEFNPFNLSCDFMEPFRILVDRFVVYNMQEITPDYKHAICDILNQKVLVGGDSCTVLSAISAYCKSLKEALGCGDTSLIKCYEL